MEQPTRRQVIGTIATAGLALGVGGCATGSADGPRESAVSQGEQNKRRLRDFVNVVWERHDLSALPAFWTSDCVNHAAPGPDNVGLVAIRAYHEGFLTGFLPAFADPRIEYVQQVGEGDRVVSQMLFRGVNTAPLFGKPATGRTVSLASIRIDRFVGDKIAEHWSVADMAGFMQQLQS